MPRLVPSSQDTSGTTKHLFHRERGPIYVHIFKGVRGVSQTFVDKTDIFKYGQLEFIEVIIHVERAV